MFAQWDFPTQTRVKPNSRSLTSLKREVSYFEVCSRTFAGSFAIPLYAWIMVSAKAYLASDPFTKQLFRNDISLVSI